MILTKKLWNGEAHRFAVAVRGDRRGETQGDTSFHRLGL
jgi:hypothetical protein